MDRIRTPKFGVILNLVMDEAHKTRYSIQHCCRKMYLDLKRLYWWLNMKAEIGTYVSKCLNFSKVKLEHQNPSSLLQQPEIPESKWELIIMDVISKYPIHLVILKLYG